LNRRAAALVTLVATQTSSQPGVGVGASTRLGKEMYRATEDLFTLAASEVLVLLYFSFPEIWTAAIAKQNTAKATRTFASRRAAKKRQITFINEAFAD
jgi:hypothetical protein